MQEAGRILLMPKGDYTAGTTYAMLDIVNHNSASWVCKKDCTGQEPSDSNTEFWQRFGTAVDMSNLNAKTLDGHGAEYFFPKSGGTITTDASAKIPQLIIVLANGVNEGGSVIQFSDQKGALGHLGFVEKNIPIFSDVNGVIKELLHAGNMASHVLPLTGGTVYNDSYNIFGIRNTSVNGDSCTRYENGSGILGFLGVDSLGKPFLKNGAQTANYELLHTGNKPTGTYTGNGDATERTIATGGIGNCIKIELHNGVAFIGARCGFAIVSDGSVAFLTASEAKFENGILTLTTSSGTVNYSGSVYSYQVL